MRHYRPLLWVAMFLVSIVILLTGCARAPREYWITNWRGYDACFHRDGWRVAALYQRGMLRERCIRAASK